MNRSKAPLSAPSTFSTGTLLRSLVGGLALGGALAGCSAILPPDQDDDGVERCDTADDCTAPASNRLEAVCALGEGQSDASPKVCVAEYTTISCATAAGIDNLTEAYDAAVLDLGGYYARCTEENLGKRGCPGAPGSGCEAGLIVVEGICQVEGDLVRGYSSTEDRGIDVKDQYCRYFFCDDSFVCGPDDTCVPCTPGVPVGQGGCGDLWINGMVSAVYDIDGCKSATEAVQNDPDTFPSDSPFPATP